MSAPFDLSNALKTPPTPLAPGPAGRGGGAGKGGGRGTGTRLDEYARPVLWVALVACGLLLAYVFYGLYSGSPSGGWADPGWSSLKSDPHLMHLYHNQQSANIAVAFTLLRPAALLLVAAMVIVGMGAEGGGYVLLGAAAFFYFGVPLLTAQIYPVQGLRSTTATGDVLRGLQTVALLLGVPGLIWTTVDIVRRFRAAAEAVAVQKVNLLYAEAPKARSLGIKNSSRLTPLQRQNRTYQMLAVSLLVVEPVLVFLSLGSIVNLVNSLLLSVEKITTRFSFDPTAHGIAALHNSDSSVILWTLLIALNLVVLSQLLRLLEYVCYRRRP